MEAKWITLMYQCPRINFSGFICNEFSEKLLSMNVEELKNWAKKEIVTFHNRTYDNLISEKDITFIDVSIKFGKWSTTI